MYELHVYYMYYVFIACIMHVCIYIYIMHISFLYSYRLECIWLTIIALSPGLR